MATSTLQCSTSRHLILPGLLSRMKLGVHDTTRRITTAIISTFFLMAVVDVSVVPDLKSKHFNYILVHVGSPSISCCLEEECINPPFDYVFRGPNGTFTSYGSSQNLIIWLARKLKYSFSFVLINETLIEKYGAHEAPILEVMNNEDMDGVATNFYLTPSRIQKLAYSSHPAWSDGFQLVVPREGTESRLFAFIGPFESLVWLLIFVSVLVVIAAMTLFSMIYKHYPWNASQVAKNKADTQMGTGTVACNASPRNALFSYFGSHTIYVINIMTNQGCREAFGCYSFRVLAGIWVLCAMVLVNSYTGIVISSLTTPKTKPSIESLDDLAASTNTKIVLRHDTSVGEQILTATSGVYKVLGDQARNNPDNIVGDPFKVAAKLETGRYAFPYLQTYAMVFVLSKFKEENQCRFKASKLLQISTGHFSMMFKKNSPYIDAHNKALVNLRETGLPKFWVNYFVPVVPRAAQCFVESSRRLSRIVPIQLSDLTSAFLILGMGSGLAVLAFSLELLCARYQRYKLRLV